MKKLSKKNQKIIDDVRDSIDVNITGLKKFFDQGRYQMVRHCQKSIRQSISGISHYLIHSDPHNWDNLKDAIHEMEAMHELSLDYYYEVLESDRFISETDYAKYVVNA